MLSSATNRLSVSTKDLHILGVGRAFSSLFGGTCALLFVFAAPPALQELTKPHATISKLEANRRLRSLPLIVCGPGTTPVFFHLPPPPENEPAEIEVSPRAIATVPPRLPSNLRKLGLRGTVKVQFTVDAQGRVVSPTILSSSNPALNQPTLDAIKQWRFEPGTRGGKRVPMKTMQPFNYG